MLAESIRIRAERGMSAAMAKAAAKERSTAAERARRGLRAALMAEGVELPPFPVGEALHAAVHHGTAAA
jgi:hypothetical protein